MRKRSDIMRARLAPALRRAAAALALTLTLASGAAPAAAQDAPDAAPSEPVASRGLAPVLGEWPVEGWQEGRLPEDVARAIQPVVSLLETGGPGRLAGTTRALLIVHEGRLAYEYYGEGFGPDTRQVSWSMAKSVTSAMVGRAVAQGLIADIDAPMPGPWEAGDPRADITWRQWLTMTDGLDYSEIGADDLQTNDVVQMMYGPGRFDVMGYAERAFPPAFEPGTHWNYSTAAYHAVGWALGETVGRERLRGWMEGEFFGPLGMDAVPEFDAAGTYLGGSLVYASARDFAKFGYLYLRDGEWRGGPFLPEGWTEFSTTPQPSENANIYGAGWWTSRIDPSHPQVARTPPFDAFHAGGHEGQLIWVVPSKELVIVRLGLMPNLLENWDGLHEWVQAIAREFPDAGAF